MDKAQDELQWQMDLEDEVEEAREEHADNQARKMLLYKEQMDKWEKQQEGKVCGASEGKNPPLRIGVEPSPCHSISLNSFRHTLHLVLFDRRTSHFLMFLAGPQGL